MPKQMNVLAILKHSGERYVFLWDLASRESLLRQFALFAADPELSFSWQDAENLTRKVEKWV